MYRTILLCTDGSETAGGATHYAITLASHLGAHLEALHVTDIRLLEGPLLADLSGALGAQPYAALLPKLQEVQREKAATLLGEVARRAAAAGVVCRTWHETGGLVHTILEYERRADLVVLGQRGEHAPWTGTMLGSSVERVVRASVKPCLVTPARVRECRALLLAYDGSGASRKALTAAINLAGQLEAQLTILTVSEPAAAAAPHLHEAVAEAKAREVAAHAQWASGDPADEILVWADKLGADLIVMGAYGHTRIRELILGSTTARVLHKAAVPVLLAR